MRYSPLIFDLESTVNRINTICTTMFDSYLYKFPNVVGIGLGIKTVNGTPLDLPSLTFLVEKKIPIGDLPPEAVIPETIDGIITDVAQVGTLKPLSYSYNNTQNSFISNSNLFQGNSRRTKFYPKATDNNADRSKVVQGGESIGFFGSGTAGTIGCAVKDDTNIYILSSGHTLAGNAPDVRPVGSPIIQPAEPFGGTESNFIASLYGFTPINYPSDKALGPTSNIVDAALARVGEVKYAESIQQNVLKKGIIGYDELKSSNINLADTVVKVGAASGETKGTVILVNGAVKININGNIAIFIKQILTTPMAKPGDSGSIGLSQSGDAFGLLMGGSDAITIYNPINEVLESLNVQIWNSTK